MYAIIHEFINSLVADEKSKCTISAYKSDLRDFARFSENVLHKGLPDIKYSDLRKWMNDLENRGLSAQTRARKAVSIRSFFRYLSKMDYIHGKNPADELEAPKLPKKQPKVISMGEASSLLECSKTNGFERQTAFRDYTIMAMFLYTGIRREELTNVLLKDVSLIDGTILIHGKGNKERMVYINENFRPILSEYLSVYRKFFKTADDSQYLFPSKKREQLNIHTVNRIVNKAMENANIKEAGVSAHILRKRFATSVFMSTHDIATTSKLLGHSSPTTTMRYVLIDDTTMRQAASAVNF